MLRLKDPESTHTYTRTHRDTWRLHVGIPLTAGGGAVDAEREGAGGGATRARGGGAARLINKQNGSWGNEQFERIPQQVEMVCKI